MNDELVEISERKCFEILLDLCYPDGFSCKKCKGREYWIKSERRIIICRKCRSEYSPLAETMFSRSHIHLNDWFDLIHKVTCSPDRVITAHTVFRELDFGSYRTVWEALNKIRFAVSANQPVNRLEGTVEFDEMVISGIESDYSKISILGALEVGGEKRLSLQMIKNPDEMNIKGYFRQRFNKGINVIADPEKLYIQNWLKLNRISYSSPRRYYGINFMNLHVILQDVRYGLRKGHRGISEKYLQSSLDEYVFVFNHNDDREAAFRRLLLYMVETKISSYKKADYKKLSLFSKYRDQ